jgi:hypothetical protein
MRVRAILVALTSMAMLALAGLRLPAAAHEPPSAQTSGSEGEHHAAEPADPTSAETGEPTPEASTSPDGDVADAPEDGSAPADTTNPEKGDGTNGAEPTDSTVVPADEPGDAVPDVVSDQEATVAADSTAVADSGSSTATNGSIDIIGVGAVGTGGDPASGDAADQASGNNTVGAVLVVSGDAAATGGTTTDSISQKALVKAVGTGEVEIVQIALIINLGIGISNTGANAATGLDATNVVGIGEGAGSATDGTSVTASNTAAGQAELTTGAASAVGNVSDVDVIQQAAVDAAATRLSIGQLAELQSLGVAFANTGLNLVVGHTVIQLIFVGQDAGTGVATAGTAAATNTASGSANIATGSANAVGNAASTVIEQLAVADAASGGLVSILQRALVFNLGVGLANTGMNTSTGNQSLNLIDLQQQAIATAFWASLESVFGGGSWTSPGGSGALRASNSSSGSAATSTGDATAVGLAAHTDVGQSATATAGSGGVAEIEQDAQVTNGGLAIANTGANTVTGLSALDVIATAQWANVGSFVASYLHALQSGHAAALPGTSQFALGDVLVDLFGDLAVSDVLLDGFGALSGGQAEAAIAQALGFVDGATDIAAGGAGPQIRVRQISGVLTVNLGVANTGANAATNRAVNVVVIDQAAGASSEGSLQHASTTARAVEAAGNGGSTAPQLTAGAANTATLLVNGATGRAVVVTGDASASNATALLVCQLVNVDASVCDPVAPEQPPTAVAPARALARASVVPSRTAAPGVRGITGSLPRTGSETWPQVRSGAFLLLAGLSLRLLGRRVRQTAPTPAHMRRLRG